MSDITIIPGPDTSRAYRTALGCFGTGVTVVTTSTDTGPLAMTANSFASVSLEPAMVLWCAAKHSKRYEAFTLARDYSIHVLAQDQMELALHFSRVGTDFSPASWKLDASGVPILNGCIARFECRQSALHDAGDHTIIVGHVQRVVHSPAAGLLHNSGQYGGFTGFEQD